MLETTVMVNEDGIKCAATKGFQKNNKNSRVWAFWVEVFPSTRKAKKKPKTNKIPTHHNISLIPP